MSKIIEKRVKSHSAGSLVGTREPGLALTSFCLQAERWKASGTLVKQKNCFINKLFF